MLPNESSSPTPPNGSTPVDRRKELKSKLAKILLTGSRLNSELTQTKDRKRQKELKQQIALIEQFIADHEIEKRVITFSDKQYAAYEAYRSREYKVNCSIGSNRSGKTYGGGTAFCEHIRDEAKPFSQYLCVTQNQKLSAANQQKMMWELLPRHMFGEQKWSGPANGFHSKKPILVLEPEGRHITVYFKTQSEYEDDQASFEGLTIDGAWVDECISEELFSAIMVRLSLSDDGRLLITTIPSAGWIYEHIENAKPDDKVWYERFKFKDNPAMTEDKIADLIKRIPLHEREVRVEGKTAMAGSLVYPEFRRDKHIKTLDDLPDDLTYYTCIDSGMDHPTVVLLAGIDKEGVAWIIDEHYARNETIENTVKAWKRMTQGKPSPWPTVSDPAMFHSRKAGQEAAIFYEHGMPLMRSLPTNRFGENHGVHTIKDMLNSGQMYVLDNCTQLIREFCVWSYKRDRQNRPLASDAYEDKNNDGLDALRYLMVKMPYHQSLKQEAIIVAD